MMKPVYVGVDDTDSPRGMCTTYVATRGIEALRELGCSLVGFPKLIRLNPNYPKKTRGNCAVGFLVECPPSLTSEAKEAILKTVEKLAEKDPGTNPGVAFLEAEKVPRELQKFTRRVVREIVTVREAEGLAERLGIELHKLKSGDGVVGAMAAIGHPLAPDHTYELIAYRTPENRGRPRRIDPASVEEMDSKTFPETFDNLDPHTGEIRITPHTPCPIFYGIRGETPEAVERASKLVRALEPIEIVQIFITNQGTDEHLQPAKISGIKPLRSYSVRGALLSVPKTIPGGHVVFQLGDDTGTLWCAAYEPTRAFREIVRQLLPGDEIVAHGGVKKKEGLPLTLNLEKIEILKLVKQLAKRNPKCPKCGKRMKSSGRKKGYTCKKCKLRAPSSAVEIVEIPRRIVTGKFEVPPRARRHLARPLHRELFVRTHREL